MSGDGRDDIRIIAGAIIGAIVLLALWWAGYLPFIDDLLNYIIEQAGAPREG